MPTRNGLRKAMFANMTILPLALVLALGAGTIVKGSSFRRGSASGPVALTIEIEWNVAEPTPSEFELSEGRVLEAVVRRDGASGFQTIAGGSKGIWKLGSTVSGTARIRLDAPVGATLLVRSSGRTARVPIASLIEGPWRTGSKDPLALRVERLPWDSIELRFLEPKTTFTPNQEVEIALGFNILTPEPTEVSIRYTLELRAINESAVSWQLPERKEIAPTNNPSTPSRRIKIPLPETEGTYVLEVRGSWDSTERGDSSRIARWLRRWRNSAARSVERKVVLIVSKNDLPAREPVEQKKKTLFVDSIDPSKPSGTRAIETGRSPASHGLRAWPVPSSAWETEPRRRERIKSLLARATGVEPAKLPPADSNGLAWSAFGLEVKHPGRPHRLTVKVVGGHPAALAFGLIEPARSASGRARVALDVCASAPPILDERRPAIFSYIVWPTVSDLSLVIANRGLDSSARLGTIELAELDPLEAALETSRSDNVERRKFGLFLNRPNSLDRFGGVVEGLHDPLALAHHLADYLDHCGANLVVLPEGFGDSVDRSALAGQVFEDSPGADRATIVARVLRRRGIAVWIEARCEGDLPGLPPVDSVEALRRGLVRIDRLGRADGSKYQPLHPDVRDALAKRLIETVRSRGEPVDGVLVRLGDCATLPGSLGSGLDDATFSRFVRETFDGESARAVPGQAVGDVGRFAARERFVTTVGRVPWRTWRGKQVGLLHDELAKALRRARPEAAFALAAPSLDDGPLGDEARAADLAGSTPASVWKSFGLDLELWPIANPAEAPILFRTAGPDPEGLEHDLAFSPDLDRQIARSSKRGALLLEPSRDDLSWPPGSIRLTALPGDDGATLNEWVGHALASLDPSWFLADSALVLGRESELTRLAKVVRSLPNSPSGAPIATRDPSGIAVRAIGGLSATYLSLANDTPYPARLSLTVAARDASKLENLGEPAAIESTPSGQDRRSVSFELPPFGISALRFDTLGARVEAIKVDHPAEVRNGLEAQFGVLAARLTRLSRLPAGAPTGPINASFEPDIVRPVKLAPGSPPRGWTLVGPARLEIDPNHPHSGQGSLRLAVRGLPTVLSSESFVPPAANSLTFRAWLRSEPAGVPVRVYVEGEGGGRTIARQADLISGGDWSPRDFRAGDLPGGGLDRVRIRFEPLAPGRIWLDDVGLSGVLTEPERLNASRALAAALQAYRERHYADFARLASSHWARRLDAEPVSSVSAKPTKEEKKRRF